MHFEREEFLILRILRDLEEPIVHAMTIVSSAIGIFVWGATKLGRPGNGGLFGEFREVFGAEYGMAFAAIMLALFAINGRRKAMILFVILWLLNILTQIHPNRTVPGSLDEYFAIGAMMISAIMSCCIHYGLLED